MNVSSSSTLVEVVVVEIDGGGEKIVVAVVDNVEVVTICIGLIVVNNIVVNPGCI